MKSKLFDRDGENSHRRQTQQLAHMLMSTNSKSDYIRGIAVPAETVRHFHSPTADESRMLEQRRRDSRKCMLPWLENTKHLLKLPCKRISVTCGSVQPHTFYQNVYYSGLFLSHEPSQATFQPPIYSHNVTVQRPREGQPCVSPFRVHSL